MNPHLVVVSGNLLMSDCDVIGHQCNCMSVMGSGIAAQIRKIYPEAYDAFMRDVRLPTQKLGAYSCARTKSGNKIIYNLYGQLDYGRNPHRVYTDYKALQNAVFLMLKAVTESDPEDAPRKVGLPYKIGCGLANGDWNIVQVLLTEAAIKYNKIIYLYRLGEGV